jgi:hypothetical protein
MGKCAEGAANYELYLSNIANSNDHQVNELHHDNWEGEPRIFNCMLCKDVLFLFEPSLNPNDADQHMLD